MAGSTCQHYLHLEYAARCSPSECKILLRSSMRGWWTLLSEHVCCVAVTFKMTEWVEQWIRMKFCIKLESSTTETIQMIQKAFGNDTMSAAQIKVWHKCFSDGWESVEIDPHSGGPATSRTPEKVERVRDAINRIADLTVWELEADLEIWMQDLEDFGETSNHPGDSVPLQPRFGALQLLAFPKTKISFEKEEISDHQWDSGKYDRAADGNSNKGFCRVFWTVEETLGELCEV